MFRVQFKNDKSNHCSNCLGRNSESKELFIIKIKNYGCSFKMCLCNKCLNEMLGACRTAKSSKETVYTKQGKEMDKNYILTEEEDDWG